MRLATLATAAASAVAALPASATDPVIEALLRAARLVHEVDKDDDDNIVQACSNDRRFHLSCISGPAQDVAGAKLYRVSSPAKLVDDAGIGPALAKRLPRENAGDKFGASEFSNETLHFAGGCPAGAPAAQFEALVPVVAGTADDTELELASGMDDI